MTTDFLTQTFLGLLSIALAILVPVLRKWGLAKLAEVQSYVGPQQLQMLQTIVEVAVKAAEQSGLKGLITNDPQSKKKFAIAKVQDFLDQHGLSVDVSQIEAVIEASLHDGVHHVAADS